MRNNLQKVAIIGKGSQYNRISKILKKKKINFFIYKPNNKEYHDAIELKKLEKFKIIFILSPNSSHINYLTKFQKGRYIFCEKPPVNKLKDLKKLQKFNYKKIYFNYNFRFSKIADILKNKNKFNLKNILYSSIINGHALAFKKEYIKNWRSKSLDGIFEVTCIHWLDLMNNIFKINKIKKLNSENFSNKGKGSDTCFLQVKMKNKSILNIFNTWSSPLIKANTFVFTNGIIQQSDKEILISGPALNLDRSGFTKKPKLIKKISIKNDYNISLEKSVSFFLNIAFKKKNFSKELFNNSLESNKYILKKNEKN